MSSIWFAKVGGVNTSSLLRLAMQLSTSGLYVLFSIVLSIEVKEIDGIVGAARVVREEVVAMVAGHKVAELVVAAVHHAAAYQAPFGDDNPLLGLIHSMVAEGIADDDVLAEQVADALQAIGLHAVGVKSPVFV